MNLQTSTRKDLLYTSDHEWIDFLGTVAYMGLCPFRLTGIGHVQQILFSENDGLVRQGAVIATVVGEKYRVPVHMPMDGKIIRSNDALLLIEQNSVLSDIERIRWFSEQWIALVSPSHPYERKNFLRAEQYVLHIKRKF